MARIRMRRGTAIDFARVERMSFRTFYWNRIGSEVEVVLEGGELLLRRDFMANPNRKVPATPAVADGLTRLFAECGVRSWKRSYEPVGYVVLDGEGWELALELDDGSAFECEGSNAWPEEFDRLQEGLIGLFG